MCKLTFQHFFAFFKVMAQSLQCNLHINDSLISTLFIMNSVDICTLKYNVILFTHMHILTL